ncbi:MAG TPA: FHA domain-containing protein [Isosphaeraceae bacterium]|nr:FHA domain-containing protein [Isosphaeraceae bacterium]
MTLRLVTLAGRPEIHVGRVLVAVGRHPHCDAQIVSPRVSRWHCCLAEVDGELWVRDLGSTNGIWINGLRVTFGTVKPGDVLAIAHIRYRLEDAVEDRAGGADPAGRPGAGSLLLADLHGTDLYDAFDEE